MIDPGIVIANDGMHELSRANPNSHSDKLIYIRSGDATRTARRAADRRVKPAKDATWRHPLP